MLHPWLYIPELFQCKPKYNSHKIDEKFNNDPSGMAGRVIPPPILNSPVFTSGSSNFEAPCKPFLDARYATIRQFY